MPSDLDGTFARRARVRDPEASTAGEWLDPLADKIFVLRYFMGQWPDAFTLRTLKIA